METFIEIITIGGSLLSGIVILYAGFLFFVIKNSETNEGFFINVPQEQVVTLEQGGAHDRFLHRGKNQHIDALNGTFSKGATRSSFFSKYLLWGRVWKGFPSIVKVKEYRLQRQEWRLDQETNGQTLVFYDEMSPYLSTLPVPYAFILSGAEDINGFALDIGFTLFLRATGAYKPFYAINWCQQMTQKALGGARDAVGNTTFDILRGELASHSKKSEFKKKMKEISKELRKLVEHEIVDVSINQIAPGGALAKEIVRALAQNQVNALHAQALITKTKGEQTAQNLLTDAKLYNMSETAKGFALIYDAKTKSADGKFIAFADAVAVHKGTLAINSPSLTTIPLS